MNFSNGNLFRRPADSIDGTIAIPGAPGRLRNRNRQALPGQRPTFGGMFTAPETATPETATPGSESPVIPQWSTQPRPPEFPNVDPQAATTATPDQILAARQNIPGITSALGPDPQYGADIGMSEQAVGPPIAASAPEPTGGASMSASVYPEASPTGQPGSPFDRAAAYGTPGAIPPVTRPANYGGMFARPKDTQENALTYGL